MKILNWGEKKKGATRADVRKDVEPAAKAPVVSEPMAIFYPGDGKSWLVGLTNRAGRTLRRNDMAGGVLQRHYKLYNYKIVFKEGKQLGFGLLYRIY